MTDQELQQLAREYAEQHPPQTEDEKLMQYGISLNATEAFEPFLRWLTKTHCIVSREKVMEQYMRAEKWLTETDNPKQHHDPIRLIAVGVQSTLESIFGTELFEERSKK